jgi:hypothetical protein
MKLGHIYEMKEHMHQTYDAKVVHTNVIAQAEVTYQEKVKQLVEAHAKEVNLLKDVQAADLSELCWSHAREIEDLKKGFEETWISFCERKEREKVMIRQEHDGIANRQTARLTLLEKEMASTHRRHLKGYTQHKHTADKEKEEAALMSMESYLNKYETGRGKWKRMAYDVFLVKTLRPALIAHLKHQLKECVYAAESLARTMDLKHGINLGWIDAIRQIDPAQTRRKGRGCCHQNSILWSSSSIKGCMHEVEKEMKE